MHGSIYYGFAPLFVAAEFLSIARGEPFFLAPPPPFEGPWIATQTRAEHGKEIEVVARELRDARLYARTRALLAVRVVPAAVASRFAVAGQHLVEARRELAAAPATGALPASRADAIQRELEAARADVISALAFLDREVEPSALALELRLRDATAALDAAEAQLARGETHLAANLPLPARVSYRLALWGFEGESRQIDLHRSSPHRLLRLYYREEQVAVHRAHRRVARARREYLAAARAHLARVRTALAGSPALTPELLTRLTGELIGADADRRALREELMGARALEADIRLRIRVNRATALRQRPQTEPRTEIPPANRQTWRTLLAALGDDLIAAELALHAALVARPPALQPAADVRAVRLRAAEGGLARSREALAGARAALQRLPATVSRWPRGVAERFRSSHVALRTALSQLDRAVGVSKDALSAWRDRSAADLRLARGELAALRTALAGKTVPAVAEADRAIATRETRQQSARDTVNSGRKLSRAERQRLLGEFQFASALGPVLGPVLRGARAAEAAMRVATGVPKAPTGVTASGGTSAAHVEVAWTARSGETYSVHRCITAAPASCGTALASGLGSSPYRDLTAPAGQPFLYRVRAHAGAKRSALSAAAQGHRRAPAVRVVTALLTSAGATGGFYPAWGVRDIAVDGRGAVYAVARGGAYAFRIAPDGTVRIILSARGNWIHRLAAPTAVAATPAGTVYVAGGASDNVFRVAPSGAIDQILGSTGDGTHALDFPADVAVEVDGDVLVVGRDSDNVFRVTPSGTVSRILSATGDGTNTLDGPVAVAAAPGGAVYVAGRDSDNVFHIAADGTAKQVASSRGDGTNALRGPSGLAVEASGDVLVAAGDTVFRVTSTGTVTTVLRAATTGTPRVSGLRDVAVDRDGRIYVSGHSSDNVLVIAPDGTVEELLAAAGDGTARLDGPAGLAVDAAGNVYVAGQLSHNAFRVSTRLHKVLAATDAGSFPIQEPAALAAAGDGRLYVADRHRGRLYTVTAGGAFERSFPLSAAAPSRVSALRPVALALDAAQNFYAASAGSHNVVAGALWTPAALRQVVAAVGDGDHLLLGPTAVVVDASQAVYVAGGGSDNVLKVAVSGTVTQLIGSAGDGTHRLDDPSALALHSDGTLYVAGRGSDNVFRVTSDGRREPGAGRHRRRRPRPRRPVGSGSAQRRHPLRGRPGQRQRVPLAGDGRGHPGALRCGRRRQCARPPRGAGRRRRGLALRGGGRQPQRLRAAAGRNRLPADRPERRWRHPLPRPRGARGPRPRRPGRGDHGQRGCRAGGAVPPGRAPGAPAGPCPQSSAFTEPRAGTRAQPSARAQPGPRAGPGPGAEPGAFTRAVTESDRGSDISHCTDRGALS